MLPAIRVAWARIPETERDAARKQGADALHRQVAPQMTPAEFVHVLNNFRMASMVRMPGELALFAIGNINGSSHYEWKWVSQ